MDSRPVVRKRPSPPSPVGLAAAVMRGERRALAQAITLVESTLPEHRERAGEVLERVAQHGQESLRVAISGVPGVGKSTFIEAFGCHAIAQGQQVAVLSVDPSSALSGGSVLGDKTRMAELAASPRAFIRPSASAGTLGGVHRRTREAIRLCEAAGFGLVLVETVGVGQSETAVVDMTDLLVLLLLPAGGDELQGIKRGIIELADIVLVNKADGDLAATAGRTVADYRSALRLLRPREQVWQPVVERCSALTGEGIDAVWRLTDEYRRCVQAAGVLDARRAEQAVAWLKDELSARLEERIRAEAALAGRLDAAIQGVRSGGQSPPAAAGRLLEAFFDRRDGFGPGG